MNSAARNCDTYPTTAPESRNGLRSGSVNRYGLIPSTKSVRLAKLLVQRGRRIHPAQTYVRTAVEICGCPPACTSGLLNRHARHARHAARTCFDASSTALPVLLPTDIERSFRSPCRVSSRYNAAPREFFARFANSRKTIRFPGHLSVAGAAVVAGHNIASASSFARVFRRSGCHSTSSRSKACALIPLTRDQVPRTPSQSPPGCTSKVGLPNSPPQRQGKSSQRLPRFFPSSLSSSQNRREPAGST